MQDVVLIADVSGPALPGSTIMVVIQIAASAIPKPKAKLEPKPKRSAKKPNSAGEKLETGDANVSSEILRAVASGRLSATPKFGIYAPPSSPAPIKPNANKNA